VAFGAGSRRRKAGFSPTDKITAIGWSVLGTVKKPDGGIWRQEAFILDEAHFRAAPVVPITPPGGCGTARASLAGANSALKMPPSHFLNLK
jgi:hypothetical protein